MGRWCDDQRVTSIPHRASVVERFAGLVVQPTVPLGEGCLLIASHLGHADPVDEGMGRLAALADAVDVPDGGVGLAAVARHLFGELGFHGDRKHYYDPANSLLPDVLRRRTGIPITLAVVVIDVARRRGVPAVGVGMPGHFLVGDPTAPQRWLDAFDDGAWIDATEARARFAAVHGAAASFDPSFLAPTPDPLVLARVLANLASVHRSIGDGNRLLRTLELRATIPGAGTGPRARAELAEAMVGVGRVADAAELYADLAARLPSQRAHAATDRSKVLRARLN